MVAYGSTGSVDYVSPGVVLKKPHIAIGKTTVDKLRTNCFAVERKILERLSHHPRIVRFLGAQGMSLLLGEANRGDLQDYLIAHPDIPVAQRLAWCRQITEAIEYIHGHGVIHSDLRPGNILVHESAPGSLDLQLCDFGGAVCEELGVDGQSLPDGPFYSPVFKYEMNTLSDIFGLGLCHVHHHHGQVAL
ncbi:hypothetical protein AK830_g11095 [Neonectria ditissima]|uniref:EKC/KEOPS complex subunit BUD32 n=1 Tax=Neonectria ditissima TaxID=78410 RepID=A0A0P7B5R3_9HYPO|nr:hypothetical protein AK830_g11095 [Neonectria ditissima]